MKLHDRLTEVYFVIKGFNVPVKNSEPIRAYSQHLPTASICSFPSGRPAATRHPPALSASRGVAPSAGSLPAFSQARRLPSTAFLHGFEVIRTSLGTAAVRSTFTKSEKAVLSIITTRRKGIKPTTRLDAAGGGGALREQAATRSENSPAAAFSSTGPSVKDRWQSRVNSISRSKMTTANKLTRQEPKPSATFTIIKSVKLSSRVGGSGKEKSDSTKENYTPPLPSKRASFLHAPPCKRLMTSQGLSRPSSPVISTLVSALGEPDLLHIPTLSTLNKAAEQGETSQKFEKSAVQGPSLSQTRGTDTVARDRTRDLLSNASPGMPVTASVSYHVAPMISPSSFLSSGGALRSGLSTGQPPGKGTTQTLAQTVGHVTYGLSPMSSAQTPVFVTSSRQTIEKRLWSSSFNGQLRFASGENITPAFAPARISSTNFQENGLGYQTPRSKVADETSAKIRLLTTRTTRHSRELSSRYVALPASPAEVTREFGLNSEALTYQPRLTEGFRNSARLLVPTTLLHDTRLSTFMAPSKRTTLKSANTGQLSVVSSSVYSMQGDRFNALGRQSMLPQDGKATASTMLWESGVTSVKRFGSVTPDTPTVTSSFPTIKPTSVTNSTNYSWKTDPSRNAQIQSSEMPTNSRIRGSWSLGQTSLPSGRKPGKIYPTLTASVMTSPWAASGITPLTSFAANSTPARRPDRFSIHGTSRFLDRHLSASLSELSERKSLVPSLNSSKHIFMPNDSTTKKYPTHSENMFPGSIDPTMSLSQRFTSYGSKSTVSSLKKRSSVLSQENDFPRHTQSLRGASSMSMVVLTSSTGKSTIKTAGVSRTMGSSRSPSFEGQVSASGTSTSSPSLESPTGYTVLSGVNISGKSIIMDGTMRIVNMKFHHDLHNVNTSMSRGLSEDLEGIIRRVLESSGAPVSSVQVVRFRNGSVRVDFSLYFRPTLNRSSNSIATLLRMSAKEFWQGYSVANITITTRQVTTPHPLHFRRSDQESGEGERHVTLTKALLVLAGLLLALWSFVLYRFGKRKNWFRDNKIIPM